MPVVEFSDPQGIANILYSYELGVQVYDDSGRKLFDLPLYCGEGKCGNRWSEYDTDPFLRCEGSQNYEMVLQLSDKDGNLSAPEIIVLSEKE